MNFARLADSVRGRVLELHDEGYHEARRVWNGRFDRRPAAIVRCAAAEDVVAAIAFARDGDLPLAVKGGGHSYAGKAACEGGLLVDLSGMKEVRVDVDARRATVGPGARWRELDAASQEAGLATTGGACSTAGVAGVALGGGSGYLARAHGLTIDNLLAAEVVTADGRRVRASEDENPDLFWALRGCGANFGVVTSFELRLHEVGPQVVAGQIIHPFEAAGDALRFYREFMVEAPDGVQCYPFFLRIPPLEGFLEEHHGEVALDLVAFCAGDLDAAAATLRPLREFGAPLLDAVQTVSYATFQQSFDDGLPKGGRYYTRAHYLEEMSDGAIDAVLAHAADLEGAYTVAYFEALGGAVARVDPGATAFPHREARYGFHLLTGWTDPEDDDAMMTWGRAFHDAMAPHATGGVYVNLLAEDEDDRVAAAYGPNLARLGRLKGQWDPENLFRSNHNIAPPS